MFLKLILISSFAFLFVIDVSVNGVNQSPVQLNLNQTGIKPLGRGVWINVNVTSESDPDKGLRILVTNELLNKILPVIAESWNRPYVFKQFNSIQYRSKSSQAALEATWNVTFEATNKQTTPPYRLFTDQIEVLFHCQTKSIGPGLHIYRCEMINYRIFQDACELLPEDC